jgi:hypothetical protein
MKTLSKTLLCMACIMLMANCEKEDSTYSSFSSDKGLEENQIFTADFTVWDNSELTTKEGSSCLLTWEGNGLSNLLGSFNVKIILNCDMSTGEFCDLNGTFYLEDGSEIYFTILNGKIIPNSGENCDYYQSCFNDMAFISGGTGRLSNAVGSFYPNVLIHNGNDAKHDKWFAKFSCEGRITNFLRPDEEIPDRILF